MWDPAVYHRFASERGRPFADLLARVRAERPRSVVDLGCGPGDLTGTLAERWPGARVTGIDSSPEMISRARQQPSAADAPTGATAQARGKGPEAGTGAPGEEGRAGAARGTSAGKGPQRVEFRLGDVRDWRPEPDTDVLVSNATLQWVPDHRDLLSAWTAALPSGAWLAIQVPGNFGAPSHRALRAVARSAPFAAATGDVVRDAPVDDAAGYADLLVGAGAAVDAWETVYVHLLPADGPDHPVLRWMEGTALRPVRAALDADGYARFRAELAGRLAGAYPIRNGLVAFEFRRVFVVAQTS